MMSAYSISSSGLPGSAAKGPVLLSQLKEVAQSPSQCVFLRAAMAPAGRRMLRLAALAAGLI